MNAPTLVVCAALAGIAPASAQDAVTQATPPQPRPTPPAEIHEVVVVTPCRGCVTSVMNSPAAVSVVSSDFVAAAPDRDVGELLRVVPGTNVARLSVREWDISLRRSTSTVASSVLGLVDGRSIYLDFLGIIAWDLIPVDPADIDRIEVVRGPASAVWGANALNGVINIITRTPRNAEGSSFLLSGNTFDRSTGSTRDEGAGFGYEVSATLSRAINDRLAYRVSASYSASDAFPRPVGTLPRISHPLDPHELVGGATLPADAPGLGDYENEGTRQPRVDLRLDEEVGSGRISYSAGIAGSAGIAHTGIGPFALQEGSHFGYGRVAYSRNLFRVGGFVNFFDVHAPSLLAIGADRQPVHLDAQTRTYDIDANHSRLLGTRNILTYGGNLRRDTFRLSVAPHAKDRTDAGLYVQDEFFLEHPGTSRGSEMRFCLGARFDKFGSIDGLVFSPRVSVIWKPRPSHSLRLSFNKAFRAPSVMNNYLDLAFLNRIDLHELFPDLPPNFEPLARQPFPLIQRARGQEDLREDSLMSYEIGYIGTVGGKTSVGFNLYLNDTHNNINFTRLSDGQDPYTALAPPPGWPLPVSLLDDLAGRNKYIARTAFEYLNLGPLRRKGLEVFLEHHFDDQLTGYFNYSWQPEAKPLASTTPYPQLELSIPPRYRVNAGVYWVGHRLTGSLTVNYVDRAFWVDVLPHGFDGYTPAYATFNGSLGVRWAAGKVTTTLRATNLANVDVQEHVYGDILKRSVLGEVRFAF